MIVSEKPLPYGNMIKLLQQIVYLWPDCMLVTRLYACDSFFLLVLKIKYTVLILQCMFYKYPYNDETSKQKVRDPHYFVNLCPVLMYKWALCNPSYLKHLWPGKPVFLFLKQEVIPVAQTWHTGLGGRLIIFQYLCFHASFFFSFYWSSCDLFA